MENLSYEKVESLMTEIKDSFLRFFGKDQKNLLYFNFITNLNKIKKYRNNGGFFDETVIDQVKEEIVSFISTCNEILLGKNEINSKTG